MATSLISSQESHIHQSPNLQQEGEGGKYIQFPEYLKKLQQERDKSSRDKSFNQLRVVENHGYILTSNFLRSNSTWAIDSLYDYCMKYYGPFGLTQSLFSECVREYIMSKPNN
jgi:hypothetical protein